MSPPFTDSPSALCIFGTTVNEALVTENFKFVLSHETECRLPGEAETTNMLLLLI